MATPQSDWRDIGDQPAQSGPAKPWHETDEAAGAAGPSRRGIKRGIAVIALIGLTVGIGVVMYWLRPIKPACLVLVGAGYETNLLLPHNVHGWNGIQVLEKEVAQDEDISSLLRFSWSQPTKMRRVGRGPIELTEANWRKMWDKIGISSYKEPTVVLLLSLHGLADAKEAYLLPNVSGKQFFDAAEPSRIAFRDVLDSLKEVKNKKVVLLLDLSPVEVDAPIGMLHNDFVQRLKATYEKDIEATPNLVVICSAGPDQRSWTSDELQSTIFGYYVTQGLKGAEHGSAANVTAWSLFDYVQKKVDTWAQTNRARKQTPILLGGESRAKGIDLVHISEPYAAPPLPTATFDLDALKNEWDRWRELRTEQAPHVHNPHQWRLYQETLLRYEQILRAGDPTAKAADLKKSLDKLQGEVAASRALTGAFTCLGNSFPLYRVLGYNPSADLRTAALQDFLATLRKYDNAKTDEDEEKAKVLARFRDKSLLDKQFVRGRLSQILLKDLQGKLGKDREEDRLGEIEVALGAPLRPAEVHLLRMMSGEADRQIDPAAVRAALMVRALAEEVALSALSDSDSADQGELYAEAISSRIKKDVEDADKTRRKGEDYLFGNPKEHGPEALKSLKNAQTMYEAARAKAQKLQRALALRDEASAEIPFFAAWLASAPSLSDQHKEEIAALRIAHEKLGANLATLTYALDSGDRDAIPTEVTVSQVAENLKLLRDGLHSTSDKLKTLAGQQRNWHALDAVLSIPPSAARDEDVQLRKILLRKQRDISTALLKNPNPEGKVEDEEPLDQRVKTRRELVRSCLRSFDEIAGADKDYVDEPVASFFLKLPRNIVVKSDPLTADGADLVKAANRCRLVPGGFADAIRDDAKKPINPVGRLRRQRMHELLLWQAERTLDDHWFEPGQRKEDPWYDVAGKQYLKAARGLFDDEQIPDALVKHADRVNNKFVATQLRLAKLGDLNWTTETDYILNYQILADAGLPQGTPMIWLEVTNGKITEKIWPRRAMTSWPKFDDAIPLDHPSFTSDSVVSVTLHAHYRGQHLRETALSSRTQPNVIVRHAPALKENTSLAVRMDSTFDYGAITILLDNSGSMKYPYPSADSKRTRYDFALDALEHVLRDVPDNTNLSILTFGPQKGDRIVPLRLAAKWFRADFPKLRQSLERLSDGYGSPIAEGIIWGMKEGYPKGYEGPKVVLALTDGDDNFSWGEEEGERHTANVQQKLRDANNDYPAVSVVVVCFLDPKANKGSQKELDSARKQFGGIDSFKNGSRFLAIPDGKVLGREIENLIRPRTQLLTLAEQEPVVGFQTGAPINYHNDLALDWIKAPVGEFNARVLRTAKNPDVNVQFAPGQKLFLTLNRSNEKLSLRRGILAYQPETEKRGAPLREEGGWVVSLLESDIRGLGINRLKQLVAIEKKEHETDRIRQPVPGLTWIELDASSGTRPDKTLRWWRDWTVPAPAYRLEMRDWPSSARPKVTAWFWPESREKFYEDQNMILHPSVPVPHVKKVGAGPLEAPVIEYVDWKERDIEEVGGGRSKKNCLIVRVRHPKGRPVWVELEGRPPGVGSEHHYFWSANSCTAYFYGLTQPDSVNLALVDLTAFKAAAQRAEFPGDARIEAPRMFVPESP